MSFRRMIRFLLPAQVGLLLCQFPALVRASSAPLPDTIVREVQQWDRGLALLDSCRADAAVEHFRGLLEEQPRRLDLLEGLVRAESRRSHADSVAPRVESWLRSREAGPGTAGKFSLARRYMAGRELDRRGNHAAAAESLMTLAVICDEDGDFLSHLAAVIKVARCRFDGGDQEATRRVQRQLEEILPALPEHPRLRAETRVLLANLAFGFDDLEEAEKAYRAIQALARRHGFLEIECDVTNALGSIMSKKRMVDESIRYLEESIAMARRLDDSMRLSLMLANLGYQETSRRELARAQVHLTEAIELASAGGHWRVLGAAYSGVAALAEMSGDRVAAVARFREAVELNRRSGNIQAEIGARQRMAYNLAMMGQYAEAQAEFETCLETLERRGSQFIMNWVLGGLALTNHKLGYLDRADEYYRRAYEVNQAMGDRVSAAWCLNSRGLIQSLRGDYRGSLVSCFRALTEYKAAGYQEGEGYAHVAIAQIFLKLGNSDDALSHGSTALDLAEKSGSEELLRQASHILATTYSRLGRAEEAESNYLRVLEIARQWSEPVIRMWAMNDLASHYLAQGRREEARRSLNSALELMRDREYYHIRSETYLLLGRAAASSAEAAEWARKGLDLARTGSLPDVEWNALSDLGLYLFRLGRKQEAEQLQLQAIEMVESLRRRVGADELRRFMMRPALLPYQRLVRFFMSGEGDPAAAFTISERSRAQVMAGRLHEALASTGTRSFRRTDPQERSLAATITFLQARLQDGRLTTAERDSLRRRVADLENEFSLMKLRWTSEEEQAAAILYPEAPEIEELQAVLSPDEHLLAYFLDAEQSYLFSVNRSRVRVYVLPSRRELEDRVDLFLRLQKHAFDQGEDLPRQVLETARRELYSLFVRPAEEDFTPAETLVIVPDGMLHRLPFAFLQDGDRFLVEKNELYMAPSLQILGYLRRRAGAVRASDRRKGGVVAIGCAGGEPGSSDGTPGAGRADSASRVHLFSGAPVQGLTHADQEAWRLAELFDGATILTGAAANEATVRSGILATADIIHFAAHSYADEREVRRSYIVLNQDFQPEGADVAAVAPPDSNDGLLQWHEIVSLDLDASLVALSSCRSAQGVLTSGEGITGLTQAFLYAGSRCVLASLTDIKDRDASLVMDRFYLELRKGASAAAALRAAQLAVLRDSRSEGGELAANSFVLVGDGAVTHADRGRRPGFWPAGIVLTGAGIAVLLLLVAYRRRGKR